MTERERQILALLRDDPLIAQQALADRLGISRAAVAGHIMNLVDKGLVLGRGYVLADKAFVLAVGAANMDVSGVAAGALVPGDSSPGRIRNAPGGVARNVAENLARLGHDVRLVSVVGDDLYGRELLENTRNAGVDVHACQVLAGHATSTYLSLHAADGDMAMAVNDMAILEQLTARRLEGQMAQLRHAGAVLLDCNLGDDALGWLFAHHGKTPVFAEPVSAFKCRRLLPWLAEVHTLKANRLELQALWGRPVACDDDIVAAADWLRRQGVRQVVVSLGERGMFAGDGAGSDIWQDAVPAPVVSTTGAGDALMAGLLHAHLAGLDLAQALPFAAGCAALTLGTRAANHVNLSVTAVQQLLAHRSCANT